MGFIEKIKSNVEMWKIEKYTKRRPARAQDFEQKDREFYRQNYKDGEYFHHSNVERKTSLVRTRSEKAIRSSENYNNSQ
ncbi:unnamed protein product [Rhizopus stolonifer]